jgi:hypothetical protein
LEIGPGWSWDEGFSPLLETQAASKIDAAEIVINANLVIDILFNISGLIIPNPIH